MDPISAVGLISSAITVVLIVGFASRYSVQWIESFIKAQEEMLTLMHEARNTQTALIPIEQYAKAGYATSSEKDVLLRIIGVLQELNVKLNQEMMSQLRGRDLGTISRLTWFLRRQRVREIAANISAQKDTLIALQVSMLARQMADLNRKIEQYDPVGNDLSEPQQVRHSVDGSFEDLSA